VSGWRTALRIARREARRAKGRSALVAAMIAIPVAGMAFLAVGDDTYTLTPEESAVRAMGAAQAVVTWPSDKAVRQLPDHLNPFPVPGDTGGPPQEQAPTDERLLALLPAGSSVLRSQTGALDLRTASGVGTVGVRMLDYANPLARGMFTPLSGRAPATEDEVALTPSAARRLGAGVGGTVRLADGSRSFQVVGTVENPADIAATTVVLLPQRLGVPEERADLQWLVSSPSPITWAQVKELNTHGVVALSRYVQSNPPSQAEQYRLGVHIGDGSTPADVLTLVGGLALLEVVLLAGPAFAVGARRRRRELALVAAAGGTPGQVRRIVLADGVVLGVVAAVLGVGLGIGAAAVSRGLLEEEFNYRAASFGVAPGWQLVIMVVAVATGLLAALVPAWLSSRQDVVTALAGRRGITRTRRRWPVLGLAGVVLGCGIAIVGALSDALPAVLAGMVVLELGLVLCTPSLVALVARLGKRTPVAFRIALRDSSRNRTAAASAISAVMAAVVSSIAVGVVTVSVSAQEATESTGHPGDVLVRAGDGADFELGTARPLPADAVATVRNTLPVAGMHGISLPLCDGRSCLLEVKIPDGKACPYLGRTLGHDPTEEEQRAARADPRCAKARADHTYIGGTFGSDRGITLVIDENSAGALVGMPAEDAAPVAEALRGGAVVVEDAKYVVDGKVTLLVNRPGPVGNEPTVTAPAFVLPHGAPAPIALMTPRTATSLGLDSRFFGTLVTTTRMPTVDEEDRLQASLGSEYSVSVDRGAESDNTMLLIIAIVAGVITLGTAAFATGLSAADGRADLATLGAIGASPRVRKMLSLSQSGVIAGLGSLLGAAAGLGVSIAVLTAQNVRSSGVWPAPSAYPITMPWLNLGIAVILVPLVAMVGAGLLTRARLPIERRL
jgi:putative ABC transport system permease protein